MAEVPLGRPWRELRKIVFSWTTKGMQFKRFRAAAAVLRLQNLLLKKLDAVRYPCFGGVATRHFKCNKRSHVFIRSHNEALSVVAMGVSNKHAFAEFGS